MWLFLVHEIVVVVASLWLLVGGVCMLAGDWVSGGWCGSVFMVVTLVTFNVTCLVTFLGGILSSSCSLSTFEVLLLVASSFGPTILTSRIFSSLFTFLMFRW